MVEYISEKQISIEEFETPFESSLLSDNRWVKLAEVVPWDKFATIYMSVMNSDIGRPGISPRMVLGALIIRRGMATIETKSAAHHKTILSF